MEFRGAHIHSRWSCFFDGLQFSSVEFYELLHSNLKKREIPNVKMYDLELPEAGMFSRRRKYYRVMRDQYYFDVCAAPFGKGFFVSWWHVEDTTGCLTIYRSIPIIGNWLVRLLTRKITYHRMDSENMFKECVHLCVLEAIDQITTMQGTRELSLDQRKYFDER